MSIATSFPLYVLNRLPASTPGSDTKQLHPGLTQELLKLVEGIRNGLASTEAVSFPTMAEANVQLLFSVRIRALQWFTEHESKLEQLYDYTDQTPSFSEALKSEALMQLHSHVRFALWVAHRICAGSASRTPRMKYMEQVLSRLDPDPESLSFGFYLALLSPSRSPQTFLHGYFHFLRQGLLLEYGLLAACEVLTAPAAYGLARVRELASFISTTAQDIGVWALQLGVGQKPDGIVIDGFRLLSEQEIQQVHRLAEQDFKAWLESRNQ